ncbi:MAG: IS66 family transposase [Betaproteobacteria bacterium]|nr:IS66 family transposase [Betaproteobacteria bacterium]
MKEPELVTATQEELDEILRRAKPALSVQQYKLLEGVLTTFVYVMLKLQNAKTSIKRFQRMLFGHRTELKHNVLKDCTARADQSGPDAGTGAATQPPGVVTPVPRPPRPGHGRNAAQAYSGAPIVECDHPDLEPGDRCPECDKGKVYDSPPKSLVKVVGQAPLGATVYRAQRLRCRLCDAIFTAPLPAAVASLPKYDSSCASMIAVLRYGNGFPHFRLEGLQASLYIPLPDATQWDIIAKASPSPRAVFEELIRQAAQAPLLHSDDTPMKVLSLMKERERAEAGGVKPVAKAINTSGIVAILQDNATERRKVVLFFTGHAHAGKNMERVLAHRAGELQPAMQMCDALAANIAGEFTTIVANCLAHGRRQVVDVAEQFPEAARCVVEALAKVYTNDAQCRTQACSPEQRLSFHQQYSQPIMDDLHTWITGQMQGKHVEPNSPLGKALNYLTKHWNELTLFLRQVGAPLDNNLCEQTLKRAIIHRKGSLFYKTVRGAEVGDIYMSLIHTCRLCDINPFDYLNALQQRARDVIAAPAQWLPWNFREQLAADP